jgi:eukaryotic-like serine/threonine-protein kinase
MGPAAVDDALLGRVIAGKFRIEALVGSGAMGTVYRARHLALKKNVAIKVMKVHGASDRRYAARFKREANAASRLDHPNSIRLLDFGQEPDGLLYIAMEFLEGRDLGYVLSHEWPITDQRIVHVLSQALAALAQAHDMAVVHRDLKPENIMLLTSKDDEGHLVESVKVCDFGVAKLVEDGPTDEVRPPFSSSASSTTTNLTAHGMTVGTPAYMSPEQALGDPSDLRSDIYQMGVILFQLLTRKLPFEAATAIKMMLKHVEQPAPHPSEFVANVNPRLEAICLRALRKKPDDRFPSAREMRAELRAAVPSGHASDPPPRVAQATTTMRPGGAPAGKTQRRLGVVVWVLIGLALVGLGALGTLLAIKS